MQNPPLRLSLATAALFALGGPLWAQSEEAAPTAGYPHELLAAMRPRALGPATMSGRVAALDVVDSNPDVFFVGAASGGLWKTVDGGVTFKPLFDDQPVASIGAISIFQRDPDVVWVGTGEGNPRNSASVGDGVFRSLDGGKTWAHLGLRGTEKIHRILVHPEDPNTCYVAALGTTWGESDNRGLFRTQDGGATWEKILYVNETTGACELVMDPRNPDRILVGMWDHRRWPHSFRSGGPGSGIYRTMDGGDSWTRLGEDDGVPAGDLGRIGMSQCLTQPDVVYALVEAKRSALLRSDDGGKSWRKVNDDRGIATRPFYFCDLRVDPVDPNRVYNLFSRINLSTDGGRTFRQLVPYSGVHPDHHDMWINPADPAHMINGNDGGIYITHDAGENWVFCANLPLPQLYHVAVDRQTPYRVFFGLQDNGSWVGPSDAWHSGGIQNHDWREVSFGDGFDTVPHPTDPDIGYSMSQGGNLYRFDLATGGTTYIQPDAPEGTTLRFNWNAALLQDPFEPNTIYYGSQFVHRSRDRGGLWEVMSPDMTTNRPEWQRQNESGGLTTDNTDAENYCSITAMAASPLAKGLLWVGTDDGRVHVTTDGGGSWLSVESRLPDAPDHGWVPQIHASAHAAGRAFVVIDNHRAADWTPYVFRTDNTGEGFVPVVGEGDVEGYCLSFAEDPVQPDLLFCGTEFGLWYSLNAGETWRKYDHGMPTASVMDMVIHPDTHDLVVGTHGRGVWILDDISILRSLAAAGTSGGSTAGPNTFVGGAIPPAIAYQRSRPAGERFPADHVFRGATKPRGAVFTFHAGGEHLQPYDPDWNSAERRKLPKAKFEILEGDGNVVRTFRQGIHQGVNRVVWNLYQDGVAGPSRRENKRDDDEDPPTGRHALPGEYQVRITLPANNKAAAKAGEGADAEKPEDDSEDGKAEVPIQGETVGPFPFTVLADPRRVPRPEDLTLWTAEYDRVERLTERLGRCTDRIAKARSTIKRVMDHLKGISKDDRTDGQKSLLKAAEEADGALKKHLEELLGPTEQGQGDPDVESLRRFLRAARIGGLPRRPGRSQILKVRTAERELKPWIDGLNELLAGDVTAFNEALAANPLDFSAEVTPLR